MTAYLTGTLYQLYLLFSILPMYFIFAGRHDLLEATEANLYRGLFAKTIFRTSIFLEKNIGKHSGS